MPRPCMSLRMTMALPIVFAVILPGVRAWLDPFRTYPRSEAWDAHLRWQADGGGMDRGRAVLKVSSFPGRGDWAAARCEVAASGRALSYLCKYDWAYQGRRVWRLDRDQIQGLRQAALALPPSDPHPPLGQLLLVSFDSGGSWTTRIYDRSRLAPSVTQLLGSIGYEPR